MKQFGDLEIAYAKAMLSDPRKLARFAAGYTRDADGKPCTAEDMRKNLEWILAGQTPRGPSSERPSLMSQLQNEQLAQQFRANALNRLPYGKGFRP